MRAAGEPPQHRFRTVIVETHAVDDGLVPLQAEQPRPRIADLRARRHGADFDKAEAEPQQRVRRLRALVEAGGHADRIGKVQAEGANRKFWIIRLLPRRRQQPQALDCHAMRVFRIEPAEQRQRERIERPDHDLSSGMS